MQKRDHAHGFVPDPADVMVEAPTGWTFKVVGTGFTGTIGLELDYVPEDGAPMPLRDQLARHGLAQVTGSSAMPKTPEPPRTRAASRRGD